MSFWESHVNDPGNCIQTSGINRVFVNSLNPQRNKQIGWKRDGNRLIIPLSSAVLNKKHLSVHTPLMEMQMCWLMPQK